ncbi:hypothetical protein AB5N19_03825 [Seiridium cardinale]
MADPTISSSLVDLGNISVLFRAAPNLKKLVVFNCFNLSNAVYLHSLTPLTFSKSLLGKYDLANMFRSCPAPESLSWEYIDEASQHGKDRAHEWEPIPSARFRLLMLDNALGPLKTLPRLRRDFLVDLLPPSLCVLELLKWGADLLPVAIRLSE